MRPRLVSVFKMENKFNSLVNIHVDMINLDNKSSYLFGRDTNVTDYPILHPSLSKQHAVLQFRMIRSKNEFGDVSESVK